MKNSFYENTQQELQSDHRTQRMDTVRTASFNIEDFAKYVEFKDSIIKLLSQYDLIMIQEWKEDLGGLMITEMKSNGHEYIANVVDRVAILFNPGKFKRHSETHAVELAYEPPTTIEKMYTKGRKKSNMFSVLYPINESYLPIVIIVCHLSAYVPDNHPNFHAVQFTKLLNDTLETVKTDIKLPDFRVIIGGDTNYRKTKINYKDLLKQLSLTPGFPHSLGLKDVCEHKICESQTTQSFKCVHEKGLVKQMVAAYAKKYARPSSTPNQSNTYAQDARLDIIATNLSIKSAQVIPMCQISDHKLVEFVFSMAVGGRYRRGGFKKRKSRTQSIKRGEKGDGSRKRKYLKRRRLLKGGGWKRSEKTMF